MESIESVKKRIEKAEKLSAEIREEFLFDYLKLKILESKEDTLDSILWNLFCKVICFTEDKNIISTYNIIKFTEEFIDEYKTKKEFNLELLVQFIIYILKMEVI